MINTPDRERTVSLIKDAVTSGARKQLACEEAGINLRTYQRWTSEVQGVKADCRPTAERPEPRHKLNEAERTEILSVANSEEFKSLPPSQIVPALADEGRYIASESSFYRVLRETDQATPSRSQQGPGAKGSNHPSSDRAESAVVLGYHLAARTRSRYLVLSLPDSGRVQS
jgi:putative transposase